MPPIVLDGTTGITTPGLTNTGTETLVNLTTTGNTTLGDASTDTLNVGNGGLVKDASGNVGIGVTSPATILNASRDSGLSTGTGTTIALRLSDTGADGGAGTWNTTQQFTAVQFYSADTSSGAGATVRASVGATMESGNGATSALTFFTNASGTNTERARIDSSGNLGVGTTSPGTKLDVNGTVQSSGGALTFQAYQSSNSQYASFGIYDSNTIQINSYAGTTPKAIRFAGYTTEYGRFDTSGNLAIGSTYALRFNTTGSANTKLLTLYGTVANSGGRAEFQIGNASTTSGDITGLIMFGCGASTTTLNSPAIIYSELTASSTSVAYGALVFGTANGAGAAERARIDSSGLLHVGETAHTDGSMFYNASNSVLNAYRGSVTAGEGLMGIYSNFGSTKSVRAYFRVDGGLANYSANNLNLSDERLKKDITLAGNYLAKICAIPVKNFRYKDQSESEDITLGVIAQDVLAVAPELVSQEGFGMDEESKQNYLSVYQTDLQYALMKCIQEQQAIIQSLTARITVLENK